jgi:hypothetical protein
VERGVERYGTSWYTRLLGTGWLPLAAYQCLEARYSIHHRYNPDPTELFHNYPLPVQSLFEGRRVDLL